MTLALDYSEVLLGLAATVQFGRRSAGVGGIDGPRREYGSDTGEL